MATRGRSGADSACAAKCLLPLTRCRTERTISCAMMKSMTQQVLIFSIILQCIIQFLHLSCKNSQFDCDTCRTCKGMVCVPASCPGFFVIPQGTTLGSELTYFGTRDVYSLGVIRQVWFEKYDFVTIVSAGVYNALVQQNLQSVMSLNAYHFVDESNKSRGGIIVDWSQQNKFQ